MEGTVLHRVVRENFETFRAEIAARTDGGGLPQFVEREFRDFLTCGALSRGFARVRCEGCAFERLVARVRPLSTSSRWVSNLQLKYACRQLHGIRITQLKGLPEARGIVEAIREKLRAHRAP